MAAKQLEAPKQAYALKLAQKLVNPAAHNFSFFFFFSADNRQSVFIFLFYIPTMISYRMGSRNLPKTSI